MSLVTTANGKTAQVATIGNGGCPWQHDRFVVRHPESCAVKKAKPGRTSSVHETQKKPKRAKEIVANLGGGEIWIQRRSGTLRDSGTIPRGNDPSPPRDRRH